MAIYFRLSRNGETVPPAKADDEMREHFGVEPDATKWFERWYDSIGLALAAQAHEKTREDFIADFPDRANVINFIFDNYSIDNGWCR